MNLNNYHKKTPLETKIKALDLLKDGYPVTEISMKLNFSKTSIYHWQRIETILRREFELRNEIDSIKSKINTPNDASKCSKIIDNILQIQTLHRQNRLQIDEKLKILDLLPTLHNKVHKVAKKMKINPSNINLWRKDEIKLRKAALEQNNLHDKDSSSIKNKRKHNLISSDEKISNEEEPEEKKEKISLVTSEKENQEMLLNEFVEKKEKIICKVDDENIQKIIDAQHNTDSLQIKIETLNLYDNGFSLSQISLMKNINIRKIKYWISKSNSLRNQALEIQKLKDLEYLKNNNKNQKINEIESEISSLKESIKRSCSLKIPPMEVKLRMVNYLKTSSLTPATVGAVFGSDRHCMRHYMLKEKEITERLAIRDNKRYQRLQQLLTLCNHRDEIKKLYKVINCCEPLAVLGSYLTSGKTRVFPSRGVVRRRNTVTAVTVTEKMVADCIEEVEEKREELIAAGINEETRALYRELYEGEYELLYTIDRRYTLLQSSKVSSATVVSRQLDNKKDLETQLSASLHRLILLHNMMTMKDNVQ